MAGYKETPRQKMIAMMYLVLTALLALNVSKEILDAFLIVNESISVTNQKFAAKIDKTYIDFEKQYQLNPEKVQDEWEDAQQVKAHTQNIINYVDSLKAEVISFTERIPFEEAKIIPLIEVTKKDDFDAPTNFFIGNSTKKGAAGPLEDSMGAYRDRMLRFINEDIRPIYDARISLKTDGEYRNADGKKQKWADHNFFHTILAADVTILNKIKAEIYNTESDIINYLYSSITEEDYKFSDLNAKVVAKSNYVFKGGDYEAEILVAAVDPTQNPIVYIMENADTMRIDQISMAHQTIHGDKGSVILTLPASSEGTKKYAGIIEMKDPQGLPKYYPFRQEYVVAKPSATISPTKMNVFYKGVDNPISISASGKADYQLDVRITDGRVIRTDTGWIVNDLPGEAYETTISIYADDADGKKFMGEQYFRVKNLPNPSALVMGADEDGKISKKRLLKNPFLICMLPDYVDFKFDFKVLSFQMIIPTGGGSQYVTTEKADGMMLTERMKAAIEGTGKDDIIIFQNIRAKGPIRTRKVKPLTITIK